MKTWHFVFLVVGLLMSLLAVAYGPYLAGLAVRLEVGPGSVWGGADKAGAALPQQPPATVDTRVLVFASDPWPPYAGHAGEKPAGYVVDILHAIFTPAGYQVRYVNKPWTRCLEETRSGQLTGLAGADVRECPDFVFPQESVGVTQPTFFVRKDNPWQYEGVPSLAKVRIGMIQDYTYAPEVDQYMEEHAGTDRVVAMKGNDALERMIQAVEAKSIDCFVENAPVVHYTMVHRKQTEERNIRSAGGPAEGVRLFMAISPLRRDARKLADLYDVGIRRLRASGELRKILAAYDLTDWRPAKPIGEQKDSP